MTDLLGVPLKVSKTVPPCTSLTFLGLELDTARQQILLPREKVVSMLCDVEAALRRKSITLGTYNLLLGSSILRVSRFPWAGRFFAG